MTHFQTRILRTLFLAFGICLTSTAFADESCDLPQAQKAERWPFTIDLKELPPTWSANINAKELVRMQSQYFSNKTSPFMRSVGAPTLSFYDHGIKMTVETRVTYSRTLAGKLCASVVGATLHIVHQGNIMLAKELVERSCVSKAALDYQLKQHQVTMDVLKELVSNQNKVKENVFEIYKNKGAAGISERNVGDSLKIFEKKAIGAVGGILQPYLRQQRKGLVETPQNLEALVKSCDNQFQRATELAGLAH